jgi:hypothetical protein
MSLTASKILRRDRAKNDYINALYEQEIFLQGFQNIWNGIIAEDIS